MAHLWAIPVAIAAYASAKTKAARTQRFQENLNAGLPKRFTLFNTPPPEQYNDNPQLYDEWEHGDAERPWFKFRGVPWGVRQQLQREKLFAPKYYVNSHVLHRSRKYIGGAGGPEWNFSQIQ